MMICPEDMSHYCPTCDRKVVFRPETSMATENRIFTDKMIKKCHCSQDEIDEVVSRGIKAVIETPDGRITFYAHGDKTYIVDVQEVS